MEKQRKVIATLVVLLFIATALSVVVMSVTQEHKVTVKVDCSEVDSRGDFNQVKTELESRGFVYKPSERAFCITIDNITNRAFYDTYCSSLISKYMILYKDDDIPWSEMIKDHSNDWKLIFD